MARVRIYLKPGGQIELKVEEVKGKKCLKLTEAMEKALGEVTDRQITSEYHQTSASTTRHRKRQKTYE